MFHFEQETKVELLIPYGVLIQWLNLELLIAIQACCKGQKSWGATEFFLPPKQYPPPHISAAILIQKLVLSFDYWKQLYFAYLLSPNVGFCFKRSSKANEGHQRSELQKSLISSTLNVKSSINENVILRKSCFSKFSPFTPETWRGVHPPASPTCL